MIKFVFVEMMESITRKEPGHYINSWVSNDELKKYILSLDEGEYGWIKVPYSSGGGHNSIHFKVDECGPRFTDAVFTDGDKDWLSGKIGHELTTLLTRKSF